MFDSKAFLKSLFPRPGIYKMLDKDGTVIYVGKARNLKKRLISYFQKNLKDNKTAVLVSKIANIEVIITESETEALVLEHNLIKEYKPRYNIIFRDDKSYPYIFLSHDDFPRLDLFRGRKKFAGEYFGPYPDSSAVRETLHFLQKVFLLRQCQDIFFRARKRPCLQYQIKLCSAPCVNLIDKKSYNEDVQHAKLFLQGKNKKVAEILQIKMDTAAGNLQYEVAANYRDKIKNLMATQHNLVAQIKADDLDVLTCLDKENIICVQWLAVRQGRVIGSKSFFYGNKNASGKIDDIFTAFIMQHYYDAQDSIPKEILLSHKISHAQNLAHLLIEKFCQKIIIKKATRGNKLKLVSMALLSARQALASHIAIKNKYIDKFIELQEVLNLPNLPERIECFDVSHTFGDEVVASCVVFSQEGAQKNAYRRFNIKDIKPGDDYAAIKQALTRCYMRAQNEGAKIPDIVMIDGGKGQLKVAKEVFANLQLHDITLLAIAKGEKRIYGKEIIYTNQSNKPIDIDNTQLAFYLLQEIRDQAHNFAITSHRKKRTRKLQKSLLENISGVGIQRKKLLLKHFGGLQELLRASSDDIAGAPNISKNLAKHIYNFLHNDF